MFKINDVVQFNENHKWCGCFGFVHKIKRFGVDVRYMIGVPIPQRGTAFVFSMGSRNEFEYIGEAVMIPPEEDEEE